MNRLLAIALVLCFGATVLAAEEGALTKSPTPDGRFALRITGPAREEDDTGEREVELVEKGSGKALIDLGPAYSSHLAETVLVWAGDSKRVAYATRGNRDGDTRVFVWKENAFQEVPLPENLPTPRLDFGKGGGGGGGVKNYGGATAPVRWLKTGELELSSELTLFSRGNGKMYKGVVRFSVGFDAKGRSTLRKVGKAKTTLLDE